MVNASTSVSFKPSSDFPQPDTVLIGKQLWERLRYADSDPDAERISLSITPLSSVWAAASRPPASPLTSVVCWAKLGDVRSVTIGIQRFDLTAFLPGRWPCCTVGVVKTIRPRLQFTILTLAQRRTDTFCGSRQPCRAQGSDSTGAYYSSVHRCDIRHRSLRVMALSRPTHITPSVKLFSTCDGTGRFGTDSRRHLVQVPYPHDGSCATRDCNCRPDELRSPASPTARAYYERTCRTGTFRPVNA